MAGVGRRRPGWRSGRRRALRRRHGREAGDRSLQRGGPRLPPRHLDGWDARQRAAGAQSGSPRTGAGPGHAPAERAPRPAHRHHRARAGGAHRHHRLRAARARGLPAAGLAGGRACSRDRAAAGTPGRPRRSPGRPCRSRPPPGRPSRSPSPGRRRGSPSREPARPSGGRRSGRRRSRPSGRPSPPGAPAPDAAAPRAESRDADQPEATGLPRDEVNKVVPANRKAFSACIANAAGSEVKLDGRPAQVKNASVNKEIAAIDEKIAKADYFPVLSASAGISSAFSSQTTDPYFNQLNNGIRPSAGFSISVPIYQKKQVKTNVAVAKIGYRDAELSETDTKNQLRKSIEQACQDVVSAQIEYEASLEKYVATRESSALSDEKFSQGIINSVDFLVSKTNLIVAESQLLQSKYNLIFSYKILDFYMGIPLSL